MRTDLEGNAHESTLYVRQSCLQSASEVACEREQTGDDVFANRLVLTDPAPGEYFVFLDGALEAGGDFVLVIEQVLGSPVRDYGEPCEMDADCADGLCFVPGTGVNSICSAACAEMPCPEGAACFQDACFVVCEGDETCSAINPSPDNPLRCDAEVAEASICLQSSEP